MREKILIHICCAVCGIYLLEELKKYFEIFLYYYNPNIWPENEFQKRLEEVKKISEKLNLELISAPYEPDLWFDKIKGYELEPEGGKRCLICFYLRLKKTGELALKRQIKNFTTTLGVSPHKPTPEIDKIGKEIASQLDLEFLSFSEIEKKLGQKKLLWQRSKEMARKFDLYHQKYCGCQFSFPSGEKVY